MLREKLMAQLIPTSASFVLTAVYAKKKATLECQRLILVANIKTDTGARDASCRKFGHIVQSHG